MRGGNEHARQTRSAVPDDGPRDSESNPIATTSGSSSRVHVARWMSQQTPTPSLLARMSSQNPHRLQGLPLSQIQESTKTFSSNVIPLSKNTERENSLKRPYTLISNQSSPEFSEMIEHDRMQHSDRSLRRSRVMIPKLQGLRREDIEESPELLTSIPPALLHRMQMDSNRKANQPPKRSKSMNRSMRGTKASVVRQKKIAEDCTSAITAEREDTEPKSVKRLDGMIKQPKYMQRSVWTSVEETSRFSPIACCTETDNPLPRLPPEEFMNLDAVTTSAWKLGSLTGN
jgi:hypothetical protein